LMVFNSKLDYYNQFSRQSQDNFSDLREKVCFPLIPRYTRRNAPQDPETRGFGRRLSLQFPEKIP